MTMTLVSSVIVGSGGASSIEWTSVPQTGKDLLVVLNARASVAALRNDVSVSFNGATTNRSYRSLYGNGFGTFASNGGQISTFAGAVGANATSNTFSNVSVYISNYTASNGKQVTLDAVIENNQTEAWQEILSGLWNVSTAISTVTLTPSTSTFMQYTTASLYIIS